MYSAVNAQKDGTLPPPLPLEVFLWTVDRFIHEEPFMAVHHRHGHRSLG